MNKLTKQVLIWLGTAIIVLSLMGCDRLFPATGDIVERVSDGDTLVLRGADNQKFTVRFACVDAPEVPHSKKEKNSTRVRDVNQFNWGVKAQTRVEELVRKSGDRVKLTVVDSDRYGRKVAEVRLKDGTFIQQVLLQEGLTKVYRSYLSKCPSKDLLQQAEAKAQQRKIGVWSDRKFVDPWEYRKMSK
ncbi:thermonuclease family protein [Sphaerospermopsis aphanizomenoides BCCUSP55]|uniref:thermonuclease family protein n=1 Tax=Sphaerospermopsis aphanizomenoides TaxID=459663 RepID=UPI001903A975|nr:thermonuclease family protein [Sphaerospermopsis aphanizomenoides]MBK1989069.1 thermonuclease family protein [Sphaerospermopsis aphanizomenoides BCCUSP55]